MAINFQFGDYFSIPQEAKNISIIPKICSFDQNNSTKFTQIGNSRISYDVGVHHVEYDICVSRAKINIILVNGQSNADGFHGSQYETALLPHLGCAYVWDWNRHELIESFEEFIPYWEPQYEKCKDEPDTRKNMNLYRGFMASLADEWFSESTKNDSPEKTVIVHSCRGGAPISDWVGTDGELGDLVDQACRRLEGALAYFKDNSDKYEVVRTGQVWLQGEGSCDKSRRLLPSEYHFAFMRMIEEINKRTPLDYTGIFAVRCEQRIKEGKALYLNGARLAQYSAAAKNDKIFMASTVTESWNDLDKEYIFDGQKYSAHELGIDDIHYGQRAYEIMGKEAARALYAKLCKKNVPAREAVVFSADGLTHYKSGEEIRLADNVHIFGVEGEKFAGAVYLCPVVYPVSAFNTQISFAVYDVGGKLIENAIDEFGVINEPAKIPAGSSLKCTYSGGIAEFPLI